MKNTFVDRLLSGYRLFTKLHVRETKNKIILGTPLDAELGDLYYPVWPLENTKNFVKARNKDCGSKERLGEY